MDKEKVKNYKAKKQNKNRKIWKKIIENKKQKTKKLNLVDVIFPESEIKAEYPYGQEYVLTFKP